MSTITALAPVAATPAPTLASTNRSGAASTAATSGTASSTVVRLGDQSEATTKALVWENRTRSTSATLMSRNMGNDELSTRLNGLGSELLKQVAYDGADFSQSVQQLPAGATSDTYALQVSPAKTSQHGTGDNQISLSITTATGIKVDLTLDASDNSIAVDLSKPASWGSKEQQATALSHYLQQVDQAATRGLIDLLQIM